SFANCARSAHWITSTVSRQHGRGIDKALVITNHNMYATLLVSLLFLMPFGVRLHQVSWDWHRGCFFLNDNFATPTIDSHRWANYEFFVTLMFHIQATHDTTAGDESI